MEENECKSGKCYSDIPTDLTRRCFHCGQQFRNDVDLFRHLEEHRRTDGGVRSIG